MTAQALVQPEIAGNPSLEKPRLSRYRALLSYDNPDLAEIIGNYLDWVSYNEYMIFQGEHIHTGEKRWKAVKCAKRGNDVYNWRLRKRFAWIDDLPDIMFFNYRDRSKRHKTRALFVTLTYARDLRLDQAWEEIGEDYNRWVSRVKRRFGGVQIIRVWEAQQDGYPHIHAVLIFESREWEAFHYNGVWRVQGKASLGWDHGFTDVEALSSLRGGIRYVIKYLNKLHDAGVDGFVNEDSPEGLTGLVGRASVQTLALMWIFHKRAFSVSGGFLDLIGTMRNSNIDDSSGFIEVDLGGSPVWVWRLVGFWGGNIGGKWSVGLDLAEFRYLKSCDSWSDAPDSGASCGVGGWGC